MEKSLKHVDIFFAVVVIGVVAIVLLASCGAKTVGSSAQEVTLEGVHLQIASATLASSFPAGCQGEAPACIQAQQGYRILSITFQPRDLPEGQMLAYKNLPAVNVIAKDGTAIPHTLYKYDNVAQTLTLGFMVPEEAIISELKWADLAKIPLKVTP